MWISRKTVAEFELALQKRQTDFRQRVYGKRCLNIWNRKEVITVCYVRDTDDLGTIVKQSNEFARNRLDIRNLMATRVLACLFSTVREGDMEFRELTISAKSILKHAGGGDYKTLKTLCGKLSACRLERKPDYASVIQKHALFSALRYERGVIFARFHPDLEPFFLGLNANFTEYSLDEFLRLPSIYSQKLFEYLKSWDDCVERVETLETLYGLLDIPEYLHVNFKDFRRRVLEKASQDIIKHTSLRFGWEALKKSVGKTSPVTAVRFVFAPERQAKAQKNRKSACNKAIQDERNRLFLESVKCFESKPNCETPKRTARCAVCFKMRGLDLPDFLQGQIPEYK
jgi:hypothetical protein